MRYGDLKKYDVTNGSGVRTTLFVTGCTHRCEGCFNSELQSFESGKEFTKDKENLMIEYARDPLVKGVSILGGEPFQQDTESMRNLLKRLKEEVGKPIWVWTGYTYEELKLLKDKFQLLEYIDVLVDGRFDKNRLDMNLFFRGSDNQRIIDVKNSLKSNHIAILSQ